MTMRSILLIARHEFVKYVTRRGFLISLFLMPAWIVFAGAVPRWIERNAPPRSFIVVDRDGGFASAIAEAVAARTAADQLARLSAYAGENADLPRMQRRAPGLYALLTAPAGSEQALAGFRAMGGAVALRERLTPYLHRDAPALAPRPSRYDDLPPPRGLVNASGRDFVARAAQLLSDHRVADAILVVPKDYGASGGLTAQFWSSGPPAYDLKNFLGSALTEALRRKALRRIAPAASFDVLQARAELSTLDPTRAAMGHKLTLADQVQRYAPSGFAFLLVLIVFMNAASLMSAVIEEKSSRIVEVMLSCVTPRQFMVGKLLGAAGASLLTLFLWLGMGVVAAWIFVPGGHGLIMATASSLTGSSLLPLLVICFVCGLLIYASIFLALGSMTASLQDAQALIGPTMIAIMAPLLIMPALLRDPNGTIATVMTWIPVYTPFFMMFRLPWNPPVLQIWLAVALMIATAAFLVWQMGRVFAANVLTSERPPRLGAALRAMVGLKKAQGR